MNFRPAVVLGGGGPENTFLLVNARSHSSKTVANHYIHLRHIPPSHVQFIDWSGNIERTDVNSFREQILIPAIQEIRRRGLAEQIDYLVYSSDFPWSIDLKPDFANTELLPQLSPVGSITGVTHLWRLLMTRPQDVLALDNNWYAQPPGQKQQPTPTYGFHSWYGWAPDGSLLEAGGRSYLLCAMLAVTSGRGTSVDEAVAMLKRSAAADGTSPKGTIYFVQNNSPRSTPRHPLYPAAVAELERLGVRAQIVPGKVPTGKSDVQGAMFGTANFDWPATGSTILPGAFCDNLTSLGGDLRARAAQTPLTELIRHGAAGSSGTVVEPYSIQEKFPLPTLHVHYARGCTLAEAFYQSVRGPYQLLLVADPLCRPWAVEPRFTVSGFQPGDKAQGTLELLPTAPPIGPSAAVDEYHFFVDGRRFAIRRPDDPFELDTRALPDGYHDLRIVAVDNTPVRTQSRLILPLNVNNHGRSVELKVQFLPATSGTTEAAGEKVVLSASSPGASAIALFANGQPAGTIRQDTGSVAVNPAALGSGPVLFQAAALSEQGQAVSAPVTVQVP